MHGDVCLQNVSALHLSSAHGVQRVSDPPPRYVGAGNQTRVHWKSSQCP